MTPDARLQVIKTVHTMSWVFFVECIGARWMFEYFN